MGFVYVIQKLFEEEFGPAVVAFQCTKLALICMLVELTSADFLLAPFIGTFHLDLGDDSPEYPGLPRFEVGTPTEGTFLFGDDELVGARLAECMRTALTLHGVPAELQADGALEVLKFLH